MKQVTKKIFAAICSATMLAGAAFAPSLGIFKNSEIVASAYSNYINGCHWEYELDMGGYAITKCRNYQHLQSVNVPTTINGQPVVAIYDNAFINNSESCAQYIVNITLPNTIYKIGKNFFRNCDKLQSITLPSALITIGDYSFYDADGLQNITFPNKVKQIGSYVCNWAYGLQNVTLGSQLEMIGEGAFARTPKLQNFNSSSSSMLKFISKDILVNSKWANDRANNDALYIGYNNRVLLRYQRGGTNQTVSLGSNVRILADRAFNTAGWAGSGQYIRDIYCPRIEYIGSSVFGMTPSARVHLSGSLMFTHYGSNYAASVPPLVAPATAYFDLP